LFFSAGFVIIGMVDVTFTFIDWFINKGIPLLTVLRLLLFKIPAIMVLFFPMATLFSVMLILIRLAKDNELVVFRTSGVNLLRVILPIAFAAVFISFSSYYTNEKIVPLTNSISEDMLRKIFYRKPVLEVRENVFFKADQDRYFYIERVDPQNYTLEGVMIYELSAGQPYPRVIKAKRGKFQEGMWILNEGTIHKYGSDGFLSFDAKFDSMKINVVEDVLSSYTQSKTSQEMSTKELKEQIKSLSSSGLDTKSLRVDLHLKRSIPFASFVFAILGTALSISFVRSPRDWWGIVLAVAFSILLVGFFFFNMAVFRSLGRGGFIFPFFSAWMPNIIFSIASVVFIVRESFYR
jgi:lipopolysaccharide export system permease protein